jgi:hypothetical protein
MFDNLTVQQLESLKFWWFSISCLTTETSLCRMSLTCCPVTFFTLSPCYYQKW